jgi:uncharacterized repeat protein (TIGR03803 family)
MNRTAPHAVITTALLRYGLTLGAAAALLTGCGGSQIPRSASPQGLMPQQSHADDAYNILHEFGVSHKDGTNPSAELINVKGTLYGTTVLGGSHGIGTVFSITKNGQETVLHSFGGPPDGEEPMARLLNVNGTLYGTTAYGGVNRAGTVFSITRGGTEKVLHSFAFSYSYSRNNGINPFAGLIDVDGTLYGTTSHGGKHPCDAGFFCGTVFSITTSGEYKVLHNFAGAPHDGNFPEGALLDVNGMLYGTTSDGGEYSRGTVFSISTSGQERTLYSFGASGYTDGSGPFSDLADVNGTLYGTTVKSGDGSGTVFSITTDGLENIVYAFPISGKEGSQPVAGLVDVEGVLYGTTSIGGVKNVGTVFSVTTSGEETGLHSFSAGGGKNPRAALLEVGGTLYGTTYGSPKESHGNVFSLTP